MGGWNIDDVCVYALKTVDIPVDTGGDDTGGGDDTAGGDDDTGDVGQADDTGEGGGVSIKPACGCAAEPAPSSGLALLGALAGLALSRRRR
ncbi:MYXO-CTERM sorting domain-containing protein [Myxococcota bacterium]|nr:MYXO-CTERM sorting domain-containing protein [Myxococcota bacterium]